jgi:hypothetical protein
MMKSFRFPSGLVGGLAVGLAVIGVLALAAAALAQSAGPYDLRWNTVDGGGGASAGGSYTLSGSAGQPDAGAMSAGAYTLAGGFWPGARHAAVTRVYLPLVVRNAP